MQSARHRAGYCSAHSVAATKLLNDPRYTHMCRTKIQGADKNSSQKKYEITFEKVARDLQKIQGCRQWRMGRMGQQYTAELGRAKLSRA